jgi:hypothetical protein
MIFPKSKLSARADAGSFSPLLQRTKNQWFSVRPGDDTFGSLCENEITLAGPIPARGSINDGVQLSAVSDYRKRIIFRICHYHRYGGIALQFRLRASKFCLVRRVNASHPFASLGCLLERAHIFHEGTDLPHSLMRSLSRPSMHKPACQRGRHRLCRDSSRLPGARRRRHSRLP